MKPRVLGLILALMVGGLSFVSHSILTPLNPVQGVNHIYYGAKWGDFLTEQLVVGDIDGDDDGDIITGIYWDDPNPGGAPRAAASCEFVPSGTRFMSNGTETVKACNINLSYWAQLGYTDAGPAPCLPGDSCYFYPQETENQGAALVFYGGNYDNVPVENDLNVVSPGVTIYGQNAGDKLLYVATGKINGDLLYDILLGAPQWEFYDPGSRGPYYVQQGRGEAFVILGSASLPSTIDLRMQSHVDTYVHKYVSGRDIGDHFGYSNAVGNINVGFSGDEIVIAAPWGDGAGNLRTNSGEVYVFYRGAGLPDSVDLAALSDAQIAGYGQVIYGASAGDYLGITNVQEIDPNSGYAPPAIAIGDWDQDGADDLVLGAGNAFADDRGAVYIIFGGGAKLVPGNTIDLSLSPGSGLNACDMVFYGAAAGDALGTGVELTDVDYDFSTVKKDLLLGAALADNDDGGATKINRGEAYIAFGATRSTLLANSVGGVRDLSSAQFGSYVDVVVYGDDTGDQFGAYFAGNGDFDLDGFNDFAIGGRYAAPDDATPGDDEWGQAAVFFGKSRAAWNADNRIHLKTALYNQAHRIFKIVSEPGGESNKVRLAKVDLGDNADLVFGGYDADGKVPASAPNAGQMYIMKGRDVWKTGTISAPQIWRDNVFITDDLTIAQGVTVTIEAGTDVYVWPADWNPANDGPPAYTYVDPSRVEVRVRGFLQVNGTAPAPVRFVAWSDSLLAKDRDAWFGITVLDAPGAGASFNHCVVANAAKGIQSNVDITIKNTTIENCRDLGLSVAGLGTSHSVHVDSTTIRNSETGINALQGMTVFLSNSTIEDCSVYGAAIYSGASLDATNTAFDGNDTGLYLARVNASWVKGAVHGCTFTNNTDGIRIDDVGDSSVVVDGCTIDDNTTNGIYVEDMGNVWITDNTITGSHAGVFSYGSAPVIRSGNTIQYNTIGVKCDYYSEAVVESCTVTQNYRGVWVGWECATDLGGATSTGRNILKPNTGRYVMNFSGYTVSALWNYWPTDTTNCNPESSKFYGPVDASYPLCDPPSLSLVAWQLPGGKDAPARFALSQNYPNPFNPTTTVAYQVPKPGSRVEIALYDVAGRLVATLVDEQKVPGFYVATWDGYDRHGNPVASGVYFLRMRAGQFVETRKLVLLK